MIGLGLSLGRASRLSSLVAADVAGFVRLIKSKGGQLGDGVITEAEAVARLTAFVTMLYGIVGGRCDFWPLQEAYQLGFGSKVYSFHGLEGTLVNGPTWEREGLLFTGSPQVILVPGSLALAQINHSVLVAGNRTAFSSWGRAVDLQGWYEGDYCRNPMFGVHTDGANDFGVLLGPSASSAIAVAASVKDNDFHLWGYGVQGGYINLYKDGAVKNSAPVTLPIQGPPRTLLNPSDLTENSARCFFKKWEGHGSFAMVLGDKLSPSQFQAISRAYKSTLGKELGLA